ncbi:DUF357 domain-containing protein, partial [Candidatus Pacearchaeota archaeon]|nr:DUF357 domain-containing protein [Candidatus Pacearchaeota archaeon]
MENTITPEKIEKYHEITEKALNVAKKNIAKGKEKEASEIIKMVSCYLQDSEYFEKKEDYINSFAAINYAHGWLDAGARLKIFLVKDR